MRVYVSELHYIVEHVFSDLWSSGQRCRRGRQLPERRVLCVFLLTFVCNLLPNSTSLLAV